MRKAPNGLKLRRVQKLRHYYSHVNSGANLWKLFLFLLVYA